MKYYIIAGEASGDLHGSNLIAELKNHDPDADFRVWGGDKMASKGAVVVKHIRDLAFMGFIEVIANIRTIYSNLRFCKKDILEYNPDAVILIDYPGFNLEIAKFLKGKKIKVIYYISPQVWAWKKSRVHTIKKVVDKLIVILPFEKQFFKEFDIDAEFAGHPLLDALPEQQSSDVYMHDKKPVVALLPGSRKQEIKKVLPVMLSIVNDFPEIEFVLAGVHSIGLKYYSEIVKDLPVKIEIDRTYEVLAKSRAALVTSGTATLETALIGIPEVVCYKAGVISYTIARKLIQVKYISLVNLIMDKLIVKELIQNDLNRQTLRGELNNLLNNQKYRETMLLDYKRLKDTLGGKGASLRAATVINKFMTQKLPVLISLLFLITSCNQKTIDSSSTNQDSTDVNATPLNNDTIVTSNESENKTLILESKPIAENATPNQNLTTPGKVEVKGELERKRGVGHAARGRYKEAIELFDKSIELDPNNSDSYFFRGKAKWQNKDPKGAEADINKAISMNPQNADYFYFRGRFYSDLKRYNEAIRDFDSAIAYSPQFYDAMNYKGVALANLGKHEQAIVEYNKVIQLNPGGALAYYNKGTSLAGLGKFAEAEEMFTQSLSIDTKYEQAYVNRGNSRLMQNKYQGAWDDYSAALLYNPNNADALYNSGFALKQLGNLDQACDNWKKAVKAGHKLAQQQVDKHCN
jgi:lipid-A-disaccharide synthase